MKIQAKAARDHVDKLLEWIHRADRRAVQVHRISRYCASFDAKLAATLEAFSRLDPDSRPDPSELAAIAAELDPRKGTDEPVRLHWKPKKSGKGHRPLLEFGIKGRALQILVHAALSEVVKLHPGQCLLHGGTHEAIKRTTQALEDGYLWAIEIDISNCYQSFGASELIAMLTLPKEVTESIVLTAHLNIVPSFTWHSVGHDGDPKGSKALKVVPSSVRRGIPQGSALSPLIAEAMMAIALKHVPMLGLIIAYADNVLLLAKSKSDVMSMAKTLLDALKAHPVGRLRPTQKCFKLGQPLLFLGHKLTIKDGVVRVDPAVENMHKFESRVESEIAHLKIASKGTASWHKRREKLEQYIHSWTANFKLCHGIHDVRSFWLSRVHALHHNANKVAVPEKMKTGKDIFYKAFKLDPDQLAIVESALKRCKDRSGTVHDTVALDLICTEYLGTGHAFPDVESALAAELKKSSSVESFLGKVSTLLEQRVPGLAIGLSAKPKKLSS